MAILDIISTYFGDKPVSKMTDLQAIPHEF